MSWFWFGLIVGVGLSAPVGAWFARRWLRRNRILQQRLQAAERTAELSMLTRGLAHEIKNPLSTINLNLQLLREDLLELLAEQPPGWSNLDRQDRVRQVERRFTMLANEVQRLRDTLEDFLRYAGRIELHRQPCDLNHLVDEVSDFFAPQAEAAGIHLRVQLSARPAQVWADADMLKQALLNLMLNATQAMTAARESGQPHGGADELILRTMRRRVAGRTEVHLHLTDTGPGIQPSEQDQVFKPYFTKRRGGTGLGLPHARRIVEEHGGTMSMYSEPGRGTDFTLALPVQEPTQPEPPTPESPTQESPTQEPPTQEPRSQEPSKP
jgi:signal transduction histidine kinase